MPCRRIFVLVSIFASTVSCFSIFNYQYELCHLFENVNKSLDFTGVDTNWIDLPIDHFNEQDNRTWSMRFRQKLRFWKTDGPIFLFIGGRYPTYGMFGLQEGLAKEVNAAMYISEHRYYGVSLPFDDFSTENLKYLTSRQAIEDVVSLLKSIKNTPQFTKSKVVVFGAGYSGNLAAWSRLLYPDLIDVAVASTAPVEAKADFHEFLEVLSYNYEKHGLPGCSDQIRKILERYEEMFKTKAGIDALKKEENICEYTDMTKLENKQLFFMEKIKHYTLIQYGTVGYIQFTCLKLSDTTASTSPKDKDSLIWNVKQQCNNYEINDFIHNIKSYDVYIKSTLYQYCTELGYFQTTSSKSNMFTNNVPLDFYYKLCSGVFGKEFDGKRVEEGVKKTNEMYGGLQPNVSNVIFVNGELDAWHPLCVQKDLSPDAPAIMLPFVSNSIETYVGDDVGQLEEIREAIRYMKRIVKTWLGVE